MFEKRPKYLGNDVDLLEMSQICGGNDLGIALNVWETAKICGKWRRSVGNVSNMWGNDLIVWQSS